jgi:hypothetical protein
VVRPRGSVIGLKKKKLVKKNKEKTYQGMLCDFAKKKLNWTNKQLKLTQRVELSNFRTSSISGRLHIQQPFFFGSLRLEEVKVRSLFHVEYNSFTTCGSLLLRTTFLCPFAAVHAPPRMPLPLAHRMRLSPCLSPPAFATLPWPLPAACATLPCRRHRTYRVTAHPAAARATSPCPSQPRTPRTSPQPRPRPRQ